MNDFESSHLSTRIVAIGLVLAVLAILSFSAFHMVPAGHRGVLLTLEKPSTTFRPEGPSFLIPFVQKIQNVSIQQKTMTGTASTASSDLQTVNITFDIMFRIPEDQVVLLTTKYSGEPFAKLVSPRAQESLKEVTVKFTAEDIVKKRREIKEETLKRLREHVEQVEIVDLVIENIDFTPDYKAAIEKKTILQQELQTRQIELEKAKKESEIKFVEAQGDAQAIEIRGKALKNSPETIQLKIVEKWDGRSPQSVVTGQGGANVILPLR